MSCDSVAQSLFRTTTSTLLLEATKSIGEKIRGRTNLDCDGTELIDRALAGQRPALALNSLQTETERGEQRGFVNLLKGVLGTFRNPTAHVPKLCWSITELDALDLLTIVSYVHRRLDAAVPTGWRQYVFPMIVEHSSEHPASLQCARFLSQSTCGLLVPAASA
jgi:uncharacterized protein (TIGR02391 family)